MRDINEAVISRAIVGHKTSDANNMAVIPANEHRKCLILSNATGALLHWLFGTDPTTATGMHLATGDFIILADHDCGSGVQGEIHVRTNAAGQDVVWTEFLAQCSCPRAY